MLEAWKPNVDVENLKGKFVKLSFTLDYDDDFIIDVSH